MLSALVIVVPRVAQLVDGWLEQTVPHPPSSGVPAHVTVLFPWLDSEEIDPPALAAARDLFAGFEPFGFTLPRLARFPTTLYLDPEPAAPFAALTRAVAERWPERQPYGGEFETVVPHLTVAQGEQAVLDAAEADVAPKLPLAARAVEVSLLVEVERFGQRWETKASFPLGA